MTETEDYDKSAIPIAHHASHEDGGADEINVSGLVHKSTCSIYLATNQSIDDLSYDTIEYDTLIFDRNNDFSLVTHRFTAPSDGKYLIVCQSRIAFLPADKVFRIYPQKNDAYFSVAANYPPIPSNVVITTSKIIDMSEHDYISVKAYHDYSPSRDILSGITNTFISVTSLY